jgi:hypothetical protein
MTLKEKFEIEIKNKGNSEILLKYKCAQIADEYAIEFAEWIDCKYYQGEYINEYHKSINEYREGKHFTAKELLKKFKEQKGYE